VRAHWNSRYRPIACHVLFPRVAIRCRLSLKIDRNLEGSLSVATWDDTAWIGGTASGTSHISVSSPYSLHCHRGAMLVFRKLCRTASSSGAHNTECWVGVSDGHARLAAVSSTGWDQKQWNFFVHILSFYLLNPSFLTSHCLWYAVFMSELLL